MTTHDDDDEMVGYRRRQLPSFEDIHEVIGGCVVVDRDDRVLAVPPAYVLDVTPTADGSRYEV